MQNILLLEDDEGLKKGISMKLQREGYQVFPAGTIEEAQSFQNQPLDLVISDITLPDGNGMEFCQRLQKNSGVYVIYLTALDREIDIVNGYDSGADDYITKPFSLVVLLSKVNAVMRRLSGTGQKALFSAGITVYPQDMQVLREEESVPLSKKEYQLLLLLWDNAQKIVTKEQILERIWDLDGQFVDENTVAVNISRLKNKLETKAISNIRGVGYLWTEKVDKR